MIYSSKIFGPLFLLHALSACSHTPESREPASSTDSAASSEESRDEFYKSLSAYRDGIAVSGYARVYSDRIFRDKPAQEVAHPFHYYIPLVSDFEIFIEGPDSLKCDQHSDPGVFAGVIPEFHLAPAIHPFPGRTVQLFSIIQTKQPKLYPKIFCTYSGPGDHLDFKITVRFPQPHRRLDDEGELLRKMREHLISGVDLTSEELNWIKVKGRYHEGELKLTPANPDAVMTFEQPNELVILRVSNGSKIPMDRNSKGVVKLIAPSRGIHFSVKPEDLDFPELKQNLVLCADSKNNILLQGDRENEYAVRGLQDTVRCLINTPKNSVSRFKGKFVVNLIRVPIEDLLKKIEEILRPQELKYVEFDSETAFQRITQIQQIFRDMAKVYPHTAYDHFYTEITKKLPPAFEAVRHPEISE